MILWLCDVIDCESVSQYIPYLPWKYIALLFAISFESVSQYSH
jgi:hypothetical protein